MHTPNQQLNIAVYIYCS